MFDVQMLKKLNNRGSIELNKILGKITESVLLNLTFFV